MCQDVQESLKGDLPGIVPKEEQRELTSSGNKNTENLRTLYYWLDNLSNLVSYKQILLNAVCRD